MRRYLDILREAAIVAYHGSETSPTFMMGHQGNASNALGSYTSKRWGAFFTDNPEFARHYGEPRKYLLNLSHTLDIDSDRGETIYEFVESLDAFAPEERPIWIDARNVAEGRWPAWHLFEAELGERFVAFMHQKGYDSAVFSEFHDDDNSKTIVVLDPSKIKAV